MYSKAALMAIVREKALQLGQFKLASGKMSTFYLDCRKGTLDSRGAKLIGDGMLERLGDKLPYLVAAIGIGGEQITAAILNNPDVKAIGFPGGQLLGNVPTYMQAANKQPGEIFNFGFDTSPQIVEAFKGGWVQLTSDQQPFLQGYLPILSLCQQAVYGLAAINVDTGAGFVTPDNYETVADLATEGLR